MRSLLVILALSLALLYMTLAWPWPNHLDTRELTAGAQRLSLLPRQDRSGTNDDDDDDDDDADEDEDEDDGDGDSAAADEGEEEDVDDDNNNDDDGEEQEEDDEDNGLEEDEEEEEVEEEREEASNEDDENDEDEDEDEDDENEDDNNEDDEGDDDDEDNEDDDEDNEDDSDSDPDSPKPTKTFDPRLPPGGVAMVTPALSTTDYYKIGDYVTFAWNYTSLSVTPSAVDVLASCSTNQATYTLAQNLTVKPTGKVIWDTADYQESATIELLTSTYTLIIFDSEAGISAVPQAGYLGVFQQWTFGMYKPQAYVGVKGIACATCSGALSLHEKQSLAVLLGTATLTVLSFGWFANGFLGGVF